MDRRPADEPFEHIDQPYQDRKLTFLESHRPCLAPDPNRSNHRIDELDAQNDWLTDIAAGRIEVR